MVNFTVVKTLLKPLFLTGCFPVVFARGKTAPEDETEETPL